MIEPKETFDRIAELYDQVRPPYPPELFDEIENVCGLRSGDRVLEIGPGTGQATLKLLRRGYLVEAVERGVNLARILRNKTAGNDSIEVYVAEFETWTPTLSQYGAVFAAASFHWIDPKVAFRKCFELLCDDGWLVLLWHEYPFRPAPEIVAAYDALRNAGGSGPRIALKSGERSQREDRIAAIAASGYFETPQVFDYVWESRDTAGFLLDAFKSQAGYQVVTGTAKTALDARLSEIFSDHSRDVATRHASTAYVARRTR